MKNKKLIKILMLLTLTMLPEIVFATDYIVCDTDKKFPKIFAEMTSTFMTIIKIAVPIILVISGMISFLKVTFSSKVEDEMKKAKTKLINSIVAAVVIFFIFSIVNFAVSLVAGANNKFMSCVNCFIDSDKCTVVTEKGEKICPGFMSDKTEYDEDCNPINNGTNNTSTTTNNGTNNTSTTTNNNINTPNNNVSTSSNTTTKANVGSALIQTGLLTIGTMQNSGNIGENKLDNFLFIGDSRYDGIRNNLTALGKNITVAAVVGSGPTQWINNSQGGYSLPQTATKISIMLGVNEINSNQMKSLLNNLHNKYPNAKIYVNSVYHVGIAYRSGYVSNDAIDTYNTEIQQFCSSNDWLEYIDVTSNLYEKDGNLKMQYTLDGLHMNKIGNKVLVDNIKANLSK